MALQLAASITEMSLSPWLTAYTVRVAAFSTIHIGPAPSGVVRGAGPESRVFVILHVVPLTIATDPRLPSPVGPTCAYTVSLGRSTTTADGPGPTATVG